MVSVVLFGFVIVIVYPEKNLLYCTGGSSHRLMRTVCPWPIGLGLMLINAVVVIVTFGVTPCGGAVGHGVSCGAPICSTAAFVDRAIAEAEISSNIRNIIAITLFFICFIFCLILIY